MFTVLCGVWLGSFYKLLANAFSSHYPGSISSPVANFIIASCSLYSFSTSGPRLPTATTDLTFSSSWREDICTGIKQKSADRDEFLGPGHKHLVSSRRAVSTLSKATELQLCLLPIVAWQRLSVAFRQTWITQMPKILSNSFCSLNNNWFTMKGALLEKSWL